MKNQKWILSLLLAMGFFATVFTSCKKDSPSALTLSSLTANGIDLNGASSATGIAHDASIIATFSTDVDASTANSTNITLTRASDGTSIPTTVTAAGNVVTITPTVTLDDGTLYNLDITASLKSTDGTAFTELQRTFTTEGFFAPGDYIAAYNFEGDATDQTGTYNAVSSTAISYVAGRNAGAGQAAQFDGSTSIIQIPNAASIEDASALTLSFWIYGDTVGHTNVNGGLKGNFVMGAGFFHGLEIECGADWGFVKMGASYISGADTVTPDFFINGDGMDASHGGWQGIAFEQDLTGSGGIKAIMAEKWAHVVITYDGGTKLRNCYLNGALIETDDFHLWPDLDPVQSATDLVFNANAGVGSQFVFGFASDPASTFWADTDFGNYYNADANHFKGMLDDVKIYHRALTTDEITAIYNSSK